MAFHFNMPLSGELDSMVSVYSSFLTLSIWIYNLHKALLQWPSVSGEKVICVLTANFQEM